MPYSLPKGIAPISFIGAAAGTIILLKDYLGGGKYEGDDTIYGKTVIITGANTGIGKETAKVLSAKGGRIILACRDMKKCEEAKTEIEYDTVNQQIICKELDLASLSSIHKFADDVNKNERFVDILINNAGIMRCPKMITKDGFEMQLGVNHLGHFLLTHLLLDKIKKSSPSRIINISSLAHTRGKINFDDLNSANDYDPGAAYNQSKLANILFTKELSKKLDGTGVTVNALHPGIVMTELGRHMSAHKSALSGTLLKPFFWTIMKTPKQGAQTSIYCALSKDLENVTGKYFSDCKEKEVSEEANDEKIAKRLWLISEKWTKIT